MVYKISLCQETDKSGHHVIFIDLLDGLLQRWHAKGSNHCARTHDTLRELIIALEHIVIIIQVHRKSVYLTLS